MPRIQPKPPMNFSGMNDEQLRLHARVLASAAFAAELKAKRANERADAAALASLRADTELARRKRDIR